MSERYACDAIVIGAGIVGAACAAELARRGLQVKVLDAALPAATAAGMGHLLVLDDNPVELSLTHYSVRCWQQWAERMPSECAYAQNGTLWLAENDAEFAAARAKSLVLADAGVAVELLGAEATARCEPMLRSGLHGSLRMPGDGIVYAPRAARWLLEQAGAAVRFEQARVIEIDGDTLIDAEGRRHRAPILVLANGIQAPELCPELPLVAKKGHLAITDRYDHSIRHTLVELGYITSAHNASGASVACNIQPRPTGQLFIGATRQFDSTAPETEAWMLGRLLRRVRHFVPALGEFNLIRSWTGFRAASPDGQPLIGPHPWREHLWLALGHEGLGVTTAPATAELLAGAILDQPVPLPLQPFAPERLLIPQPVA